MSNLSITYINTSHDNGKYIHEAMKSASSFRRFIPEAKYVLYTDNPDLAGDPFDEIIKIDFTIPPLLENTLHYNGQMLAKIQVMINSCYDRNLILGSDTYAFKSDVKDVIKLLDYFDMAVAHAPTRIYTTVDGIPNSYPEFNCDLIAFNKSDKTRSAFLKWEYLYKHNVIKHQHDQGAFRHVMFFSDLRIATLPPEFNYRGFCYREDTVVLQRREMLNTYLEKQGDKGGFAQNIWSNNVELITLKDRMEILSERDEIQSKYENLKQEFNKISCDMQEKQVNIFAPKTSIDPDAKSIVVVIGMHRSGTSTITRGLRVLGVDLGNNLMPANHNNEKGFWEDIDIVNLDIELLENLGLDWDKFVSLTLEAFAVPGIQNIKEKAVDLLRQKLISTTLFGIKDPRMTRLMPFWQGIFDHLQLKVTYIIACRNPLSVAKSLAKRNGFAYEKSYYLWLNHMVDSINHTEEQTRIVVEYENMMEDPAGQLARIANVIGVEFDSSCREFIKYKNDFLEESLQHTKYTLADLSQDSAVPQTLIDLYQMLMDLGVDNIGFDDSVVTARLNGIKQQFMAMSHSLKYLWEMDEKLACVSVQLAERNDQIALLNKVAVDRDSQIYSLQNCINQQELQLIEFNTKILSLDSALKVKHQELEVLEGESSKTQQYFERFLLAADIMLYKFLQTPIVGWIVKPFVMKFVNILPDQNLSKVLIKDNEEFVLSAYNLLLGRTPDSEGLKYYCGRLINGVSKVKILEQICDSSEYKDNMVSLSRHIGLTKE